MTEVNQIQSLIQSTAMTEVNQIRLLIQSTATAYSLWDCDLDKIIEGMDSFGCRNVSALAVVVSNINTAAVLTSKLDLVNAAPQSFIALLDAHIKGLELTRVVDLSSITSTASTPLPVETTDSLAVGLQPSLFHVLPDQYLHTALKALKSVLYISTHHHSHAISIFYLY